MNDVKRTDARPVFRLLAGITCPVFVFMGVISAFPGIVGFGDEPSYFIATMFLWGGIFFGVIAATGRFEMGLGNRIQIFQCAGKYVSGEITLEEFGSQTKKILAE